MEAGVTFILNLLAFFTVFFKQDLFFLLDLPLTIPLFRFWHEVSGIN